MYVVYIYSWQQPKIKSKGNVSVLSYGLYISIDLYIFFSAASSGASFLSANPRQLAAAQNKKQRATVQRFPIDYVYIFIYMHIYVYVCICIYMYVYTYIYKYGHINMYVNIYTYIYPRQLAAA